MIDCDSSILASNISLKFHVFFFCIFCSDGSPHLYQTDPTGNYSEWTANAIGRSSKTVTEYLEKHHETPETCTESAAVRLTVSALLEVVESGGKNIEIAVIRKGTGMELINQDILDTMSKEITEEKE